MKFLNNDVYITLELLLIIITLMSNYFLVKTALTNPRILPRLVKLNNY